MSLFGSSVRPPRPGSEEAVRRYVEAIRAELEPDPLFRRRLRGVVMNRFVADREGLHAPSAAHQSRMGRLGRAALYASFAMAVSVGGVMAASGAAMPGDALYSLKRQVEALRLAALPSTLHDELHAIALAERLTELQTLAGNGDWTGVAALAESVRDSYEQLLVAGTDRGSPPSIERELATLETLFERLPVRAQAAVTHAVDGAARRSAADRPSYDGRNATRQAPNALSDGGRSAGGGSGAGTPSDANRASATPSAQPATPSERPQPTPRPTTEAKPDPTQKSIVTPEPTPTPVAQTTPGPRPAERPGAGGKAEGESDAGDVESDEGG